MIPFSPKPLKTLSARPHGLSRQHTITLGSLQLVPDLSGAVFAPDHALLLVADLHLEQGASLARRGLHVPPYDTLETLAQLERVLAHTGARRLVLLGDSFHDAGAHAAVLPEDAARLRAITQGVDTVWISGNHDPEPPQGLGGTAVAELLLGDVVMRHIPARTHAEGFEIAGHLHPGAAIVQRGQRIQRKCFACDGRRLILPAFGSYTGALNVRAAAFKGLWQEKSTQVWMIGRTAIHCFPYGKLG